MEELKKVLLAKAKIKNIYPSDCSVLSVQFKLSPRMLKHLSQPPLTACRLSFSGGARDDMIIMNVTQ